MKVALCIPSMGQFDDHMAISGMALCIESTRRGIDLALACQRFASPAQNRNRIVEQALGMGSDYLMWKDTDMVFPADALVRLIDHNVDVVGCTYGTRDEPYVILGKPLEHAHRWVGPGFERHEFERLPGGFMLVRSNVYYKVPPPWYAETVKGKPIDGVHGNDPSETDVGEDTQFCWNARAAGFKIWCDVALSREIGHVGKQIVRIAI